MTPERERRGHWMRQQRERQRVTVKEVARRVEVSRAAVEQWELGTREPSYVRFIRWARSLALDPAEALRGVEALVE